MKSIILIPILVVFSLSSCTVMKEKNQTSFVDSDLDGVIDSRDDCPLEPGSPFNIGCPIENVDQTESKTINSLISQ